eukprot:scaffold8966_cov132-Isochrysis_galbana.AAC.6
MVDVTRRRHRDNREGWCGSISCLVSGGALLAPHTSPVCDRKIPHAPERGVGRPPCADPPPSEHEV